MSTLNQITLFQPEGASLRLPDTPLRVLGIDLGTTNSTVAEIIWDPRDQALAQPRCLTIRQETFAGPVFDPLVPSMVAIHSGHVVVGDGAKRLRTKAPGLGLRQNENLFFECKNDMGIRRTYHRAPQGFRSAAEIASKVLAFLKAAADSDGEIPVQRTVVTVPASFQAGQRQDTLRAAELAGIPVAGGGLLDEPVAAFLDYVLTHGAKGILPIEKEQSFLVFDFGGGTCDVAIFRLLPPTPGSAPLAIAPLSVSRYHRLGGGDIDRAIVHEVLIPLLMQQNGLTKFDLSFEDKKTTLEPQLMSMAESLKISLCREITRRQKLGIYEDVPRDTVTVKVPGAHTCRLGKRELSLQAPTLSAAEFERLLHPFLDTDLLYARKTEYRMTCSLFAPLADALERGDLQPEDIAFCLLVGGSSLPPQVVPAIASYFPASKVLTYPSSEDTQTTVARGAAWHSLFLALFGRGLIDTVSQDEIALRTASGTLPLIPKGARLPFPPGPDLASLQGDLRVPLTALTGTVPLRVEVLAAGERTLFTRVWEIPAPVGKGDPLLLQYRYDENQTLDLRLALAGRPGQGPCHFNVENPLTQVVNPARDEEKIEELEEDLRLGKVAPTAQPARLVELARLYAGPTINQKERALAILKRVQLRQNQPDAEVLNLMGLYAGELGDLEREEKYLLEAAAAGTWMGPLFNLALAYQRRGRKNDAVETLDRALKRDRRPPYLVLRAILSDSDTESAQRAGLLQEAVQLSGPPDSLEDWELYWLGEAARLLGDQERLARVRREQTARRRPDSKETGGVLPEEAPRLRKVSL